MPKSRRDWSGARAARHDPLRRAAPAETEIKAEVIPVLAKLPTAPGEEVPTGEKVWALASVSMLVEGEAGDKNRRLLLSRNIVGRILYAIESDRDLEVRREATGALRNLCVAGDADIAGEVGNKGGVEVVLRTLRWATLGLQNQERQLERARAPVLEARERLRTKPVEEMNRKERRQAAKLASGALPRPEAEADATFGADLGDQVDVYGWSADAALSLAAMNEAAAVCLVEMCENLVVVLGSVCETSDKLLSRALAWDWHTSALATSQAPNESPFAGADLAAWLCQATALGAAFLANQTPYSPALSSLGLASASTLCALSDDPHRGLARPIAGLVSHTVPSKKAGKRADPTALPTPGEQSAARGAGHRHMQWLAQALDVVTVDAAVDGTAAALAVLAAATLCNVQRAVQSPEAQGEVSAPVVVGDRGPLGPYLLHEAVPRLLHVLAPSVVDAWIAQQDTDRLATCELALEVLAELMSMVGHGDEDGDEPSIADLPLGEEDETMDMDEEEDAERPAGDLERWVFTELLQTPLLPQLLALAAPRDDSDSENENGALRRALALRALAVVSNLLLRLALFAPPPPSNWPSEEETLERISAWRQWVGTSYLEQGDARATPTSEALQQAWSHIFAIASYWAALPSVVDAETATEVAAGGAALSAHTTTLAQDGLATVDTALGCLWSIARIVEGQLPLVQEGAPAPYVTALMAAYQSARFAAVRVKSLGTLALLARSQAFAATASAPTDAYMDVYARIAAFFVEAAADAASTEKPDGEVLAAVLNAIIDTYADEAAPWDRVYRQLDLQTQLTALVPRVQGVVKRMDRRVNTPLYAVADESVQNLRAFLAYRASV